MHFSLISVGLVSKLYFSGDLLGLEGKEDSKDLRQANNHTLLLKENTSTIRVG